jgi:hypothetical protein
LGAAFGRQPAKDVVPTAAEEGRRNEVVAPVLHHSARCGGVPMVVPRVCLAHDDPFLVSTKHNLAIAKLVDKS